MTARGDDHDDARAGSESPGQNSSPCKAHRA
eukprot:CAMPEP_0185588018 /NCGR_PEP_ID=MMETSP0434-20130131/51547_1 /TAXON_ID=626734 ORGANISM="Favella taraikaensis, Strain Fe Narragansett Bay" /NCGR_SAMPLE_ID=MMETSP0434 /ASSEMBLY_ACC=CAM_ASM_000379 /LENGTH=30 /DNA_ID= /DNA_START= /DNA_END= /DNA_ORIENTATION=